MSMTKTLEEYAENGGWSSSFFAMGAIQLINELKDDGVHVLIGRTVIHVANNGVKRKCYVHHNGRNEEFATITDQKGEELFTAHYTEFDLLRNFLRKELGLENDDEVQPTA